MSSIQSNETFFRDIDKILACLESQYKQFENTCEEWQLATLDDEISPSKLCTDAKYEISYNNKKINRKEMICVVYGRVNSGKSMLINAMLGRPVLPTSNGSTTNSIITVRKSEDDTDYVIYPDSSDRMNINTIHRVDCAERSLKPCSKVQLFLSLSNSGVLQNNVVIIDTPAIDRNNEMDTTIHDVCKQADLLILVVDSTNDISETDKNFLLRNKTIFSKFKIIIVFNHWDEIDNEKKEFFKFEYSRNIKSYLFDDLGVKDDEGIFFISAVEKLNNNNNDHIVGWEKRDQSFDNYMRLFNQFCGINNDNRRLTAKKHIFEIITAAFDRIRIHQNDALKRIVDKVNDSLSKFVDANEFINKAAENLFYKYYELSYNRGLEMMMQKDFKFENTRAIRNSFIFEHMTVIIESLKIIIIDFVWTQSAIDGSFIILAFEKLYFQYYIDAKNYIDNIKICNSYSNLQTMIKEIIIDSYKRFIENIPKDISRSFSETEINLNKSENDVNQFKVKWEHLFMLTVDTTQSFISNVNNILKSLSTVCKQFEDLCKDWALRRSDTLISPSKLAADTDNEISYNNKKLERNGMICVVYGRVSSGKSTLINAMLGREILPSGQGSTTNSFITIKKSDDNTDYVICPDSSERKDISSIIRVDVSEKSLTCGSKVQLFLSGHNSNIIQDNVVIIDTPGIDTDVEIDIINHDMCKQADLVILVVNSTNDISDTDKNFLLKQKTIFSKFKLIIVFNHWDEIKDSKKDFLRDLYRKSARNLCKDLDVENNQDDEGIFFLSAEKKLNVTNNVSLEWIESDKSFNSFIGLFNQYCSISNENRIKEVMKKNLEIITGGFKLIKDCRNDLEERLTNDVTNALRKLIDMNEIINKLVETLFVQNYEIFFNRGLNTIRLHESELENAANIMNVFIGEQIVVIVESLKVIVNDKMSCLGEEDKDFIMKIFAKLYFHYFINVDVLIAEINKYDLYPVFTEILTTIQKHRKFAIAGISFAGTAIVGPIGIGVGIVFPVINAIAIPVAVATFSGVGTIGAAITAKLSLMRSRMERALFKPRYADLEFHLLNWWAIMKTLFKDSFERFLEQLPNIISITISKIGNDFDSLEDEVNQFKEKWGQLLI